LPCFGGSFLLCLFTWISILGVCLCPTPFLWGRFSVYQSHLLSMCYDSLLFVFQFCEPVQFWMLLTGSGDDLCDPLPALLSRVAYHTSALSFPAFPVFVY
jgi:hypothetical protein